jgi:hypothetical protein
MQHNTDTPMSSNNEIGNRWTTACPFFRVAVMENVFIC